MDPLIKWPGGKRGELPFILPRIPAHETYCEPFFGGGAVYWSIEPKRAIINDINPVLMEFYRVLGDKKDSEIKVMRALATSWDKARKLATDNTALWFQSYTSTPAVVTTSMAQDDLATRFNLQAAKTAFDNDYFVDPNKFLPLLLKTVAAKITRIKNGINKKGTVWINEDIQKQLVTAAHQAFYNYLRDVFEPKNRVERAAQFIFQREFAYGAMFRTNAQGKFNIPYGGASYNEKNFNSKIDFMLSNPIHELLKHTTTYNESFETLAPKIKLTPKDFVFLDPPYDTEFSDYDDFVFAKQHQEALAKWFYKLPCAAMMVISKTPMIDKLYIQDKPTAFQKTDIMEYGKKYMYNTKGRNERDVIHLMICNYPISNKPNS